MKTLSLLCMCLILSGMVYATGQIDISYAGYTISQPGSYIVVDDLYAATNQNAITIQASDVTINLNGHVLYGAGTATGSTGYGVYAGSAYDNIAVYNGTVRDFRYSGIYLNGENHQISRIRAYANRIYGIYIYSNGTLWDNTVRDNIGTGIYSGSGCVIRDNSVRANGGNGIFTGNGCTVTGNSAYSNGADGIYASIGCTVTGNSAYSNGADGIYTGSGCTVKDNTVQSNTGDGINALSDCRVVGNTCDSNTGAGINAAGSDTSVIQNSCTDNGTGLLSGSSGNYFQQNMLSGNTTNESLGGSTEGAGDLANVEF